jgi:hypothetical protein
MDCRNRSSRAATQKQKVESRNPTDYGHGRSETAKMLNLETAVGTTDFADNTDKEGIAVEGVFTRRVAAKEVLDHNEALSHPCHPWFLNCRI